MAFFYLFSGLFLGWSLGANDAANVFGTAVGTRMIRFKTAAIVCSIFVILGAVIGGAGATHTLTTLGSVNAIAGAFVVTCSAAFTVYWMLRWKIPVSTSQAIVGAIIGWNLFSGYLTDYDTLIIIVMTWMICPVLAAFFAMGLFLLFRTIFNHIKLHLLELDLYTRLGLWIVGAFGSYSLGANNIANVMGVFVPVSPFHNLNLGIISLSGTQQLFLLGGLAIAVGVFTYSKRVMETVGSGLFKLSPEAALVVVLAHGLVLFVFSSETLADWLILHGLPSPPLVPVSSTQAVIGAIIGIAILKGAHGIKYSVLGEIASGWITTPIIASLITFVALFFFENVFKQEVKKTTTYYITEEVFQYLETQGIQTSELKFLQDQKFDRAVALDKLLKKRTTLKAKIRHNIIKSSEYRTYFIDPEIIKNTIDKKWLSAEQLRALTQLQGKTFHYKWQLLKALEALSESWRFQKYGKHILKHNKELQAQREYILKIFQVE